MNIKGIIYAISAAFFFGLIPTTAKISYEYGGDPNLAIFARFSIACFLIAFPIFFIKIDFNEIFKHFYFLLLISCGFICLTFGLLSSVNYIPVSLTALIFYTYPLVIISYFFIKTKKLTISKLIGFLSAFIGLGLALTPTFSNLNIYGVSLALLASFGASIILITNEYLAKYLNALIIHSFINILCLCFFITIILAFDNLDFDIPLFGWFFIIFASLCYFIALLFQLNAVKVIGSTQTSLLLYLEPLVAISSAILFLNESLTFLQIIGVIIVIISLIMTSRKF